MNHRTTNALLGFKGRNVATGALALIVGLGFVSLASAQSVVCKGEWTYRQYEKCQSPTHEEIFNEGAHPDCGVKTEVKSADGTCPVVSYQSCRHSSHGTELQPIEKEVLVDNDCHKNCSVEKKCTDAIPELLKVYPNADVTYVPKSISEKRVVISKALKIAKYETSCKFRVAYSVNKEMVSDACPVKEREKCKTTKVYNSCEHRDFGVKGYAFARTKACPIETAVLTSAKLGLSHREILLNQEVAPETLRCSTCDTIGLLDNAIGGRTACLLGQANLLIRRLKNFEAVPGNEEKKRSLNRMQRMGVAMIENMVATRNWILESDASLTNDEKVVRLQDYSDSLKELISRQMEAQEML